jgi:DNA-binding beta-propeller fold protein YncE
MGTQTALKKRRVGTLLVAALLLAAALAPAAQAAESPPLLRQFCLEGTAAGQCSVPRGIAVDPASGDAYLADSGNNRIEKLTAWGQLLRAWGWDVVASGPDDKGTGFEVCVPENGDVCKGGLEGSGAGEFVFPQGVALDSAGDVYVVDASNRRVQKFSPEGEFLLTFGGEVDKAKVALREEEEAKAEPVTVTEAEENLCTAASGDQCGAGTEGTGKGQFGAWKTGSYIAVDSKGTASAADDVVYLGDQGRVQEFDTGGHYLGDLPDPDKVLEKEGTVNSLAVDPASGSLYLSFFKSLSSPESKPNVQKLSAAGKTQCTIAAHDPSAIAVGPGGSVYLVDGVASTPPPREIERFDANCGGKELLIGPESTQSESKNEFSIGSGLINPTGIAVSSSCGIEGVDLFIGNPFGGQSFVKIFGSAPKDFSAPCNPPPSLAPSIDASYATAVGSEGATVKANINPHFWPDTSYRVQYASAACIEAEGWGAPCVNEAPAAPLLLSEKVIDADIAGKGIFLGASEPLLPDAEYRYRFTAQSSGGGPVSGEEESLRTYPSPAPAKSDCENQANRSGASAHLPDCRAYELVSPAEKNGGEVAPPPSPGGGGEFLAQASSDGEALTFASTSAFAEPEAAPLISQYLSQRGAAGWSTASISAPRSDVGLVKDEATATRYKLFDESLCSGWLLQDTDLPLVEGEVPRGVPNLYRRAGLRSGCGAPGYELDTTVFPPGYDPEVEKTQSAYYMHIQGFSADGETSVFRASAALAENACDTPNKGKGIYQVYLSREGTPGVPPTLLSVLPDGEAACTHSSVGTSQSALGAFNASEDSLFHAVSSDGSRVYWTATADATPLRSAQAGAIPGQIYLRLNSTEPQSALEDGGASGTGNLSAGSNKVLALIAAAGSGDLTAGSKEVSGLETTTGRFIAGQPLNPVGGKIAAGTTVEAVDRASHTLTLSAAALGSGEAALTSKGPMPFAPGQRIAGVGIPFGTTIAAVAAGSLTLSANATVTVSKAPLSATSPCTEPAAACTLAVSEEAEALSGTHESRYLSAATDGSAAIFLSGEDLYEFDLAKALAGEPYDTLIAHNVKGILGASADASSVYLVSSEDLDGGGPAQAGQPNLYLFQRGAGISFVATLAKADTEAGASEASASPVERLPFLRTSRVSPDGQSAAFTSASTTLAQSVAGYDNTDVSSGRPDQEVYLYDATANEGAGKLICATCNPSGARPAGRQVGQGPEGPLLAASRIPGWITAMHPGNALSANGRRLFFESFEALIPRDTNGRADVYEWERATSKEQCLGEIGGDLYEPSSEGCLGLISSGQGAGDSQLIDASADGRDVFIRTDSSLLPADNGAYDAYDARALGGFPEPKGPPAACEGEACQSPPAAPEDPTPASSSFQGAGNAEEKQPASCRKPKVRRKGRCVAAKHKQHKRSHKRRANPKRRTAR